MNDRFDITPERHAKSKHVGFGPQRHKGQKSGRKTERKKLQVITEQNKKMQWDSYEIKLNIDHRNERAGRETFETKEKSARARTQVVQREKEDKDRWTEKTKSVKETEWAEERDGDRQTDCESEFEMRVK